MSFKLSDISTGKKRAAAFFVLFILGAIIYSNTLHAPFVFDDHESIETNPDIRSLPNAVFALTGNRYLTYLSFSANYAFGGLDTFGYHLVNVLIHILNAVSVYLLVTLTFKTPLIREFRGDEKDRLAEGIAFASSLIFLTHPVQTQAVTYISQRLASLATFFYLLSIILYIKARISEGGEKKGKKAWAFYILSITATVMAQKTKEITFTLPLIIALYEFAFFDNTKGILKRLLFLAPFLLTLFIIPLTLLHSSAPAAGGEFAEKIDRLLKEELSTLPRYDYLATQFRVIVTYLRLLVLPVGQNLDYDYPVFHSIFTPQVFLSFLFLSAIFLSAVYLYYRSRKGKNIYGVLISSGVIWFFVTLSIESSIIPISDVIFEHRLYLPGVGAFIAFSSLLFFIRDRFKVSFIWAVVLMIAAVNSVAAYERNLVWKDELTLWKDTIKKSPDKARAYHNIGYSLVRMGKTGEAIGYFEKVIKLKPGLWVAYNNMGTALLELNRPADAINYFNTVIKLKPEFWGAYNSIGEAYLRMDKPEEAAGYFDRVIKLKPDLVDAYNNMGYALAGAGRPDEAVKYLKTAVKLQPSSPDAHNNLGNALLMLGRLDEAIGEYQTTIKLKPDHANARANLENALQLKGNKVP